MDINSISLLLADFSCAKQGGKGSQSSGIPMIIMFVAIFAVFYFLLIRPQQKKQKQLQQQIQQLKNGDKIITSGGIKGKVLEIKQDIVVVQSGETKIEVMKAYIAQVIR